MKEKKELGGITMVQTADNPTTTQQILCCLCGIAMSPNPANMCPQCMSTRLDISEGIGRECTVYFCRGCDRYLRPPWVTCELESTQLLSLCLKKIKGLGKVKLIDAGFVWTEPHSKRLKVKITIQKEAMLNLHLQQTIIIEFIVAPLQCEECKKSYTPHIWSAAVQIRQKAEHKKSMFLLEQMILKHGIHDKALNVKEQHEGIDFYFKNRSHAMMLNDFIMNNFPSKSKQSKQLISLDENNNTYNYKYSFSVELAPICKEDLVLIPKKLQKELGGSSPLAMVTKVSSLVQLLDMVSLKTYTIDNATYWKHFFGPLCSKSRLTKFIVLNIDPEEVGNPYHPGIAMTDDPITVGKSKGKHVGDYKNTYSWKGTIEVQRDSDFGNNDTTFLVRSHVGEYLNILDYVLAYDLESMVNEEIDQMRKTLPDVVIVRKFYPPRKKRRIWKLKHISKEDDPGDKKKGVAHENREKEYHEFLEELEEDEDLRSKINLYKDNDAIAALSKQMDKLSVNPTEEEKSIQQKPTEEEEKNIPSEPNSATVSNLHLKEEGTGIRGRKTKKVPRRKKREERIEAKRRAQEIENETLIDGDIRLEDLLDDLTIGTPIDETEENANETIIAEFMKILSVKDNEEVKGEETGN